MDVNTKKQSPTKTILFSILMMLLCLFSAKYVLFTALLLPLIGAYVTAKLPPSWSLVYYVAAAAACFVILPGIRIVAFLMLAIPSLLTGIAVKKKMRTYEGVLLSCTGWVLSFAVVIAASYIAYGAGPLTMIVEKIREAVEGSDLAASLFYTVRQMHDVAYAGSPEAISAVLSETQRVLLTENFAAMREAVLADGMVFINNSIALDAPTTALTTSLLGGLFSYLLARHLMKRSGEEVSPVPAFKDFKLPRNLATPLAIVFALALGVSLFDIPMPVYTACNILINACSLVFCVQAVTLIHWFISLRSKSKAGLILLSIFIPLIAAAFNALPWLGFFEMLFKLRYNVIIRDGRNMPPGKQ